MFKPSVLIATVMAFIAMSAWAQQNDTKSTTNPSRGIQECFGYNWPREEVPWIITNGEQTAYARLRNDEERDQFVEQFWSRRDPTPTTLQNEFKDTYYERILYANENFGSHNEPGWRTPRGRIYVMYGPPDSLERRSGPPQITSSFTVVANECPLSDIPTGPHEVWKYLHIAGVDHPVSITFANACKTGKLVAITDNRDAEWLSQPPVPKYKLECNGKYDPNHPPPGLQGIVCLDNPPVVQFKELEEIVSHHVRVNMLPLQVGYEFKPVTSRTVQFTIEITLPSENLQWDHKNGESTAEVAVYGRVTTITNHIADSFERSSTFMSNQAVPAEAQTIKVPLYLYPYPYRIDIVLKDTHSNLIGTFSRGVVVPNLGSWCQ